jgi:hypothetical protein
LNLGEFPPRDGSQHIDVIGTVRVPPHKIVFTAVANAVERSLAMGAMGVASKPTMTDCNVSEGGVSVCPPTTASTTATSAANALVQLRYTLSACW